MHSGLDGLTCAVVVRGQDPVLRDHRVHGTRVLPGVTFLDVVFRVLRAKGVDTEGVELRRVLFQAPVAAGPDYDTDLLLRFTADGPGRYRLAVTGARHRHGRAAGAPVPVLAADVLLGQAFPRHTTDLDALRRGRATADMADLYALVRHTGIEHGDFMRGRGTLHVGPDDLLAELSLGPAAAAHCAHFPLHPAALDAATLLPTRFARTAPGEGTRPYIPMLIGSFRARGPLGPATLVHARPPAHSGADADLTTCDLDFYDEHGVRLAWLHGLTSKRVRDAAAITRLDLDAEPVTAAPVTSAPVTAAPGPAVPVAGPPKPPAVPPAAPGVAPSKAPAPPSAGPPEPASEPAAPAVDPRAAVTGLVRGLLAARGDEQEPREEVGFYDLGLDSTALLGVSADLEKVYGEQFSPTLLFEHSTPGALVEHLLSTVGAPPREAPVLPLLSTVESAIPADVVWFQPTWVDAPIEPSTPAAVLLVGDGEVALPAGVRAVRARFGAAFATTGDGYVLDPESSEDWRALLGAEPTTGVLWRPTGDIADEAVALTHFLAAALRSGPRSLVYQSTGPTGAVAGLLRTAVREQPTLRAMVVRTDDTATALAEFAQDDIEVTTARGRRQVREFHPTDAPATPVALRERGVYLITGAFGGVGRALARHLARTARARLVLCGRAPDQALAAELTGLGGEVAVVTADVTRAEDVRNAVDTAHRRFGALHGVIHAAGVLRDGLIAGKGAADVRAVLAPKVDGARHLAAATRDLDFLLLCSSSAAAWGNPGQADYACANGFLDDFAATVPGSVSVGWPAWADGGMPVDSAALASMGLAPMPTATAVDILLAAAGSGQPHLVALVGDAGRITAGFATAPRPRARRVEPAPEEGLVAIVGVSGRYPMARDLDEFWANLRAGRDCVTEVPADRWDHDEIHSETRGVLGRSYGRWGGFLDGIDEFDARFFHISPNEAAVLDPQERLFLQAAWHAFEEAGHAPSAWRGRAVGVFAGVMYNQYQLHGVRPEPGLVPSSFSGSVANRVSHFLDLRGPSLALDTMCSSSLTALHLAVEAIRRGECEAALAGGVNLAVHRNKYLLLSQANFLSTDGRCRAFGTGGDGYVPGEGVGVVLLRPLSAALRDGDHVHAVIRATALNHGGHTAGFSVPSPAAQSDVVAAGLAAAGVDPAGIGYLEAHGTGTSLGDPIEVTALERAFDTLGAGRGPWPLGSVKSNLGHLESAAGIASLTKVLLQLRHGELVPSLHAEELNPAIDWDRSRFRVQRQTAPWPAPAHGPRTAAISSFGAGGANAHVVLAAYEQAPAAPEPSRPRLFALSARDADRLTELARSVADHLAAPGEALSALRPLVEELVGVPVDPTEPLAALGLDYPQLAMLAARVEDVFGVRPDLDGETTTGQLAGGLPAPASDVDAAALELTLWAGRDHFDERLAVVAEDAAGFAAALRAFLAGDTTAVHRGKRAAGAAAPRTDDLDALAAAWVGGAPVSRPLPATARRLSLPGYPFERTRHWVETTGTAGHHPLDADPVDLPDGSTVFTGALTPARHPWLAEHTVAGATVVPGALLVEAALRAGERLGCPTVAELVTEVPLAVADADLRLVADPATEDGTRAFALHARIHGADWVRHATGTLSPGTAAAPAAPTAQGDPVDVRGFYPALAAAGTEYGPAFQGLRAAHRHDGGVRTEIVLAAGEPGDHLVHPALLDAALHGVALGGFTTGRAPRLPFAWTGVCLHQRAGAAATAHLTPVGPDAVALLVTDADGHPVLSVDAIALRPSAAPGTAVAHRVAWTPVELPATGPVRVTVLGADPDGLTAALGAGADRADDLAALAAGPVAPVVIAPIAAPGCDLRAAAHAAAGAALDLLRDWLAEDRFAASKLVVLTRGAHDAEPALATAHGLVRAAQAEHPGRFALVDCAAVALGALRPALSSDEPQLALRADGPHAPRLVRGDPAAPTRLDIGTAVVTGAGGALAAPLLRHLVHTHGARDLLLLNRSGRVDEALLAELAEAGARAVVIRCDVTDRAALAAALATVDRPVGLAVHTAGVLADGVVTGLDRDTLARVLAPKVDGAVNLHELLPEAHLVLYSSAAGVFGGPGQGAYAAANAFLDALARHRAEVGGRATALAWGPWAVDGGMVADADRLLRGGIGTLDAPTGLALFDAALSAAEPDAVPVLLDTAALRAQAAAGTLPPLLRALAPAAPAPAREDLAALSPDARRARLSVVVRAQAAAVLGYPGPSAIDPDRSFDELGFDSLTSVEFRNRLAAAVGLQLPATTVFDHPTPLEIVAHLDELLGGQAGPTDLPALFAELDRVGAALAVAAADAGTRTRAAARVRALLTALDGGPDDAEDVLSASDEEVFALLDAELGRP
ncbi:SDR family NAD(P)-dependent oxidoreductase [Actinokineospora sp. 24-640]